MSQVLCETDASGNITAYYIYGAGLLAKITPDGAEHYYHYDGLGSTVALTDEDGFLTDQYAYEPFGETANSIGSTDNPFRYVGRFGVMTEPDGTLFMRARFYDADSGRFLSKDPLEGVLRNPSGLHKYNYAWNNPLTKLDPDGQWVTHAFAFLEGFGESVVVEGGIHLGAYANVLLGRITPEQAEATIESLSNAYTLWSFGSLVSEPTGHGAVREAGGQVGSAYIQFVKDLKASSNTSVTS